MELIVTGLGSLPPLSAQMPVFYQIYMRSKCSSWYSCCWPWFRWSSISAHKNRKITSMFARL